MIVDLFPGSKPGGRPRKVSIYAVINAILYVLCQGCTWRALPGDFPAWSTVYGYFWRWQKDGTWLKVHDKLYQWVRVNAERESSPSEAAVDSQSVETATMISEEVGYDAGKQIHGRKRHLSVDLLGLVLRVLVTSASVPERAGAKKVLKKVHDMGGDSFGELRLTHFSLTHHLDGWGIPRRRIYEMGNGCIPLDCGNRS